MGVGMLDTSTVILLGRIADPATLPQGTSSRTDRHGVLLLYGDTTQQRFPSCFFPSPLPLCCPTTYTMVRGCVNRSSEER